MGRDISLFSDFHQGENRITNYCGLILKMIYQESPAAFQETIVNLLGDLNTGFDILPVFHQQEKKSSSKTAKSIPDLILRQSSFNIYFEVKTTDWFYEDQVNRHLNNLVEEFKNADNKILFLLTSEFNNDIRDRLKESISTAEEKNTIIQIVTFEEFISAVKEASDKYIEKGRYINSVIPEFEEFLDRSGLLPSWKHTIDVTPCGATINEIENGMYICPATSGAYNHTRSKFFGAYWGKSIRFISEISGIVIAQKAENGCVSFSVQWSNIDEPNAAKNLENEAQERFQNVEQWRKDELDKTNLRIFVLDSTIETNIEKKSKGGIRRNIYWYDIASNTVSDLASELENKDW